MKSIRNLAAVSLTVTMVLASVSHATLITENFDSIAQLNSDGWVAINRSNATGTTGWFQGLPIEFGAHEGPASSYVAANFENAGDGPGNDTISNWLISPVLNLTNGDTLSFWTRSASSEISQSFSDRLQLRLSTSDTSTNVGGTALSVGDFGTLLLDINSTYSVSTIYPQSWTQFSATISGLPQPASGRFAFRYFVEDGGPNGSRSNYLGIDSLEYTAVPEPATFFFLAVVACASRKVTRTRSQVT